MTDHAFVMLLEKGAFADFSSLLLGSIWCEKVWVVLRVIEGHRRYSRLHLIDMVSSLRKKLGGTAERVGFKILRTDTTNE